MHGRDLRPADAEALEAGGLDQLPRGPGTALALPAGATGVLEHAAAARLAERRALLAPAEQLRRLGAEPRRVLRLQVHVGLDDDPVVEPAPPVGERDLPPLEYAQIALRVHHGHPLDHVGPLAAMAAGVHVDAPPHGPRDAHEPVQAGVPGFRGAPGRQRGGEARTEPPPGPVPYELVQALPKPDDQRVEARVREQDVGPEPEREPGHPFRDGKAHSAGHVVDRAGQQHRRWSADAVRRVAAQRLTFPYLPADAGAETDGEGRIASGQPVHSADISRASACHSWSERTSPARLRSAITASHAADAADSVVV
jgi:hypothetical protein